MMTGASIAYQGIAGASLSLTDQLDLTLDYRYFAAPDVELSLNSGGQADSSYRSHNIMLGLRFSFGAPEPAATPVQAPAPAPAPEPEPAQAGPRRAGRQQFPGVSSIGTAAI